MSYQSMPQRIIDQLASLRIGIILYLLFLHFINKVIHYYLAFLFLIFAIFAIKSKCLTIQFIVIQYRQSLTNFTKLPILLHQIDLPTENMSKTKQCASCSNYQQKLKILQADYDFQIKKLSEDKSAEKALYQLSTNKQIKKLTEKCQKEKQEKLKDNQNWMKKYDQLIERQKLEISQYKLKKDKEVQDFKKFTEVELSMFKTERLGSLQKTIQSLKQEKQALNKQLTEKHYTQISLLRKTNEQAICKLLEKHKEEQKKKCNQYEAIIVGVQSQKTVQESLHKKTKEQGKKIQAKYLQEIYNLKKTIIDHEERISTSNMQITEKSLSIDSLKMQIVEKEQAYNQSFVQLQKEYREKYFFHQVHMNEQFQLLCKKQLQNCTKYEKALQKIQQHRDIENKMYRANLQDIKGCVEERPSRVEDVEQIMKLKEQIFRKQRYCQKLIEQLKWYRLELENKQETYNKIFTHDTKSSENVFIKRKDMKLKRAGRSVTTVREILGFINPTSNLVPLMGNLQKKLLPPKQTKML